MSIRSRAGSALVVSALVVAMVQVIYSGPAQAVAGDTGPAVVPLTDTSGLVSSLGEWDTKNQHRIWWNDSKSRWDAILPAAATTATPPGPAASASQWWIARGVIGGMPSYGPVVNTDSRGRPDVYWDTANERLYVLVSTTTTTVFSAFDYNSGPDSYTLSEGPVALSGMGMSASRAAIYRTPNGNLWASRMGSSGLMVARSGDGGASWADPVNLIVPVAGGQTQLTHFTDGGTFVAVAAAEDGDANGEAGRLSKYLFYRIGQGDATWDDATMAQGTLTLDVLPTNGDTLTVDTKTYTFQTVLTDVDGNVAIGASLTLAQARLNLVAAFDRSGIAGVDYAASMKTHPTVSMDDFSGSQAVLTAKESGAGGNAIVTTETFTALTNVFDAATLGTTTAGASSWTSEVVPLAGGPIHADDELSLVKDGSDNIYIATETQNGGPGDPQVVLFDRTPGGTWTQTTIKNDQGSASGDRKRPVVAILDADIYVISTIRDKSESGYLKAPLSTLAFPNPNNPTWTPLFDISSEHFRNNIVPRFPTTTAKGLPVLIDNVDDDTIWQTKLPNSGNQPPGVSAGVDQLVGVNLATTLPGVVTNDLLGNPVSNAWTKISGPGAVAFGNATSAQTTATFDKIGNYVLRLTATETGPDPLSNQDEVTITVQKDAPPPPAGPTVGLVDPSQGFWNLRNSVGAVTSFFYGVPGDFPFMGDWDCDGVDTPGLFRQSDAFAYLRNSNTQGIADIRFFFGNPSDIPLAGDFNNDGCDTLSLYRPSTQEFFIINELGENEGGLGAADFSFVFGNPGDKPVVGDWDGDGIDEVGLHRESTGLFYWRNTLTTGNANGTIFFGDPGDRFVAGDWGIVDGKDTPAVFRPSDTTVYFRYTLTQGNADAQFVFGQSGWLPVAGEFGLG